MCTSAYLTSISSWINTSEIYFKKSSCLFQRPEPVLLSHPQSIHLDVLTFYHRSSSQVYSICIVCVCTVCVCLSLDAAPVSSKIQMKNSPGTNIKHQWYADFLRYQTPQHEGWFYICLSSQHERKNYVASGSEWGKSWIDRCLKMFEAIFSSNLRSSKYAENSEEVCPETTPYDTYES